MLLAQRLATISLVEGDEDAYSGIILCGRAMRESRKSCAFCANRAIVQCDGDRCIRQLCDDHRWSSAEDLEFCPLCEHKFLLAAATPKQIELFGSTVSPDVVLSEGRA
jgi:hypothetical protein